MTTSAGRFDITSWDEEIIDDAPLTHPAGSAGLPSPAGAKLVRVRNTKRFEGGLSGTSAAELLQALARDDAAAYVGIERVTTTLDGRKGTFVLRHSAATSADGGDFRCDVVPNSGTGDLTGLRGELSIVRTDEGEHTYAFEYELP